MIMMILRRERLEIDHHCIVLLFGLAISLEVKSSEKSLLDLKEVVWRLPEFQGENQALITHN